MNALLQIIPNLINLIKELPLKNKMIILIMLISLGGGYLFYDRYLDYKLATFEKPSPQQTTDKTIKTDEPQLVERIAPKVGKTIARASE